MPCIPHPSFFLKGLQWKISVASQLVSLRSFLWKVSFCTFQQLQLLPSLPLQTPISGKFWRLEARTTFFFFSFCSRYHYAVRYKILHSSVVKSLSKPSHPSGGLLIKKMAALSQLQLILRTMSQKNSKQLVTLCIQRKKNKEWFKI